MRIISWLLVIVLGALLMELGLFGAIIFGVLISLMVITA